MLVSEGSLVLLVTTASIHGVAGKRGCACAKPYSGILADRTVSQIIGVLLTVSLCQADHRRRNALIDLTDGNATDVRKILMNMSEKDGTAELS